jgi:flavin reductase (DIM6/NTAB) family NADH-FMN oxidoreductase RutF
MYKEDHKMAKKSLGAQGIIFPGAVLLIGTYDKDGNPDVMNAAWAGQCGPKHIAMNLSKHKTTENLEEKQAFTIAFGTKDTVVESDYVGIVSANDEPDKVKKAGFTVTKGENVDAPVINEMPLSLECRVVSMGIDSATNELRVVGEIVNVIADESVLTDGKVDFGKVSPIIFDGASAGYWSIGERVGNAFKDGAKLK